MPKEMSLKRILIFIMLIFFTSNLSFSRDLKSGQTVANHIIDKVEELEGKFRNDKEVVITSFGKIERKRIINKYQSREFKVKAKRIFFEALSKFLNKDGALCELRFVTDLEKDLENYVGKIEEDDFLDILKMLRIENAIDDIFYDVLESVIVDKNKMLDIDLENRPIKNIFKNYEKRSEDYDLESIFLSFKNYPDEDTSCSYQSFIQMRKTLGRFNDKVSTKNDILSDLSLVALDKKIINLSTYNKIKYLINDSTIKKRRVWLNDYFRIIFNAKNKMIPFKRNYKVINLEDENKYSSERLKRFSEITRRKILYQKYDENQIILLAQVMKKASQRMGVDPDTKMKSLYFMYEFESQSLDGSHENYVEKIEIDPQSQFTLARRLLRKDLVALQMMETFQKVNVTYEDLVLASLETGYISLDDIDYVVKYDDLWNPEVSSKEKILNMTFKIAGYATFVLPPPWNIVAALALSISEGIVNSKKIDGASNDNPNTFIE